MLNYQLLTKWQFIAATWFIKVKFTNSVRRRGNSVKHDYAYKARHCLIQVVNLVSFSLYVKEDVE